jgi:hypothetical protein
LTKFEFFVKIVSEMPSNYIIKPEYSALIFPKEYPDNGKPHLESYRIRSKIYELRHKGWSRDEIIGEILKDKSINKTAKNLVGDCNRCLGEGFDFRIDDFYS